MTVYIKEIIPFKLENFSLIGNSGKETLALYVGGKINQQGNHLTCSQWDCSSCVLLPGSLNLRWYMHDCPMGQLVQTDLITCISFL